MMLFILYNSLGFIETAIGIWIFGKIFPRRQKEEPQFTVGTFCTYGLIYLLIAHNFIKADLAVKLLISGIGTLLYLALRWLVEEKLQNPKAVKAFYGVVKLLLFIGAGFIISWNTWLGYISNGMIALANIMMPFFLYGFYRCQLRQAYLWEWFYLCNIGLLRCIYAVYVGKMENQNWGVVNITPLLHRYSTVVYGLMIYGAIVLLFRYLPVELILKRILEHHKRMLFLVIFIEWWALTGLMISGIKSIDATVMTVTFGFVIITVFASLFFLTRSLVKTMENEKKLLDVRNTAVELQYRELQIAYEQNRQLIHDEKQLIQYVGECLDAEDYQAASRFLREYRQDIAQKQRRVWTGISTLDFILNVKKRLMDEQMIEFTLEAELDSIPMEDADFVVLLGNLLDNAIEAAGNCEVGKREIRLMLKTVNEMFLLQLSNTSSQMPERKERGFLTSKSDKSAHGFGIKSVESIVEKYQGDITFHYDGDSFEVAVRMDTDWQ